MSAVVTAPNNVRPELVEARTACADAIVRGYGATRVYAHAMNAEFGTAWFVGEETEAVKAEKSAFYAVLKAGNHSNPSMVWGRLKKESAKIVAEAAEAAKKAEGGEGEEAEESEGSGKAKHTRSPQLRYVEDLTGLYKMGKREMHSLTDAQKRAHALIAGALAEIGVDIALL